MMSLRGGTGKIESCCTHTPGGMSILGGSSSGMRILGGSSSGGLVGGDGRSTPAWE